MMYEEEWCDRDLGMVPILIVMIYLSVFISSIAIASFFIILLK